MSRPLFWHLRWWFSKLFVWFGHDFNYVYNKIINFWNNAWKTQANWTELVLRFSLIKYACSTFLKNKWKRFTSDYLSMPTGVDVSHIWVLSWSWFWTQYWVSQKKHYVILNLYKLTLCQVIWKIFSRYKTPSIRNIYVKFWSDITTLSVFIGI